MTPTVAEKLEPWCLAAASGALRVFGSPGGAVYLAGGEIVYAESPMACGVDRMLATSGQVRPARGRADPVAPAPTAGVLGALELESLVLAALHSAALFLFDARADVRFEVGAEHPMAGVVEVDFVALRSEIGRRRAALQEAWPDARVDHTPIRPARRINGHHVALTALQWEIVVNAGRRRTPVDLARLLGRDTYATLLATRHLIASGLIVPSPILPSPIVPSPAVPSALVADGSADVASGHAGPAMPKPRRAVADRTPRIEAPAALPRRKSTVDRPAEPLEIDDRWSDHELIRIRDALDALR